MSLASVGPEVQSWMTLEDGDFKLAKRDPSTCNDTGSMSESSAPTRSPGSNGDSSGSGGGSYGVDSKDSGSGGVDTKDDFDDFSTCADASRPLLPSLLRQGPSHSIGSAGHNDGTCKPCAFYCFSECGCRDGENCVFCHLFHKSKLRQRKDTWKKGRKSMHKERIDRRRNEDQHEPVSNISGCDEMPVRVPVPVASTSHTVGSVSKLKPKLAYILDQPDTPIPPFVPEYCPSVSQEFEQVCYSWSTSLPSPHLKPALPIGHVQPNFANAYGGPQPLAMATDAGALWTGATNSLNGGQNKECFFYTPSDVVIAVGQSVELLPTINRSGPLLFAVAPALPPGLELDTWSGLIHGAADEAAEGDGTYFVTVCEPLLDVTNIRLAMLRINVVDDDVRE